MWMTKKEGKGKRILASLLVICMVFQLFGWNLGSFSALASENEERPLQKTITVSGKEILKAIENNEMTEVDEELLPYLDVQNEIAKDHLEGILSQAVIVKQKALKDRCAAIVAVEPADEEQTEESFQYERILLIGINGNKNRDCEFTLEITDASGIVVKEVTMTGYRQDWQLASDSNATATDSNATPTNSDAIPTNSDAALGTSETVLAEDTQPQSGSDAKELTKEDADEENDRAYLFVQDYQETLNESAANGLLVQRGKGISFRSLMSVNEDMNEQNAEPRMLVRAGGMSVAAVSQNAKKAAEGKIAEVGVYVDEKIWNSEENQGHVKSGELFAFYAKASYSAVENTGVDAAYFTIKFETDRKDLLAGPETDLGAKPVGELSGDRRLEWEKIEALLGEEYDEDDDWKLITVESFHYFYSAKEMRAVFDIQNQKDIAGSSINGMPFRFRFQNGLTPDQTDLVATPGVLNQKALEEDYTAHNDGASADGKVQVGAETKVECNAQFAWKPVTKTQNNSNLGNIINPNSTAKDIIYDIKAAPQYGADKSTGVIYTKAYTVYDEMLFHEFYIDSTGYEPYSNGGRKGELYFRKAGSNETNTNNMVKLLGIALSPSAMREGIMVPMYADDDQTTNKIIGVRFEYTIKNETLEGDHPSDLTALAQDKEGKTEYLRIWLHLQFSQKAGMLRFTKNGTLPTVTNQVDFDAYSVTYEGEEYPSNKNNDTLYADQTRHHSHAGTEAAATEGHGITKKAFRDQQCTTEAIGENQVFGPDAPVYYQITVSNYEYKENTFRVSDTLPDGIDFNSVKLIGLTVGGAEVSPLPQPTVNSVQKNVSWQNITIPAGQSAVFTLEGKTKSKEQFEQEDAKGKRISTLLENKAQWFVQSGGGALGTAWANVYVKLDALTADQVRFSKMLSTSGDVRIGSSVEYTLSAQLADKTMAPQQLTITDHWPAQLTLTKVSLVPAGATVTLKNAEGVSIGEYKNTAAAGRGASVPQNFVKPGTNVVMDRNLVRDIANVEIQVFVSGTEKKDISLFGTVNQGDVIKNTADTSAGNHGEANPLVALAMKIEKKAYRVKAEDAKAGITEENSLAEPVDETITFSEGDVVCYEVKVTSTGSTGQPSIAPIITDDISNLFGNQTVPQLAKAALSGKLGSVFARKEAESWSSLTPVNGKISLDLKDAQLAPGETETIRIYVVVPADAVGLTTKTFANTAQASLRLGEHDYPITASATISTLKLTSRKASIQKDVIAVAQSFERANNEASMKHAKWNDRMFGEGEGFSPETTMFSVGTGDYVFYRIKLHNESDGELKFYEIEDWLPEGMEFTAFYTLNAEQKKPGTWGCTDGGDTLRLGRDAWSRSLTSDTQNWLFYDDAENSTYGKDWSGTVKHSGKFNRVSTENGRSVYRARVYGGAADVTASSNEIASIKPDGTIVFGIIAKVTGNFTNGHILTNKAGYVVDSSVGKDFAGDFEEVTDLDALDGMGAAVGGKTYSSGEYKVFTDTASVRISDYTPGIEKNLAQYNINGTWEDYDAQNPPIHFAPTDWMRWEITLENGLNATSTTGPIEEYTVSDTLPLGFTYNSKDTGSNVFLAPNNKEVKLPTPNTDKNANGNTVVSWNVSKTAKGEYKVSGAENEEVTTKLDLSIPARGSIALRIGTQTDAVGLRYGSYENRADLVPAEKYAYDKSCDGVVEGSGKDRTIYATAKVNIYGSGRTEAWKGISGSYHGNNDEVTGKDDRNYVLSDAGGTVRYDLNVQNMSGGTMKNLVLMDRLPAVGDNGLVNNSKRRSDFAVSFAKDMKLTVAIDGTTLSNNQYAVYYASWSGLAAEGSALSDNQWRMGTREGWDVNREDDSDSLRIEIEDEDVLKSLTSNSTLTVSFDAVVPEAEAIRNLESAIAWNTFGYSYEIGGASGGQFLTVEPAKVGVKIPKSDLYIGKRVTSPIEGDKTKPFTFVIEERKTTKLLGFVGTETWVPVENQRYQIKEGEDLFTGTGEQAGTFTLTNGQQAHFTVPANAEYRVKELDADGFTVKVTKFDSAPSEEFTEFTKASPPSVNAEADSKYFCTFLNTKNSLVLPETGGVGVFGFHTAGVSVMLLAFLMLAGLCFCRAVGMKKKEEN